MATFQEGNLDRELVAMGGGVVKVRILYDFIGFD